MYPSSATLNKAFINQLVVLFLAGRLLLASLGLVTRTPRAGALRASKAVLGGLPGGMGEAGTLCG